MKTEKVIDELMEHIPIDSRYRWCGGERGACACIGCVQIWNRATMAETFLRRPFFGDPERIDESKIPLEIRTEMKVTREEWENWTARHPKK